MTSRATFGDLAGATTRHLDTLPPAGPHPYAARPGGDAGPMADAVRAAVRPMARYAGDAWAVLDVQRRFRRHHHAPWIRAASRAREALDNASAYLDLALASARPPDPGQLPAPAVAALLAAAQSMTAGRDLLRTHLAPAPGQGWQARSDWAPVVTSIPIARALLHQIGGWAAVIAPHGSQAAVTAMTGDPQARRDLNHACQWLWVLTWAVEAACEQQPIPAADLDLLHAIPACVIPPRLQPSGGEQVTSLCHGIIRTAERARAAAHSAARRAAWSPALTRDSMRQVTDNCTATCWNIGLLLRALAQVGCSTLIWPHLLLCFGSAGWGGQGRGSTLIWPQGWLGGLGVLSWFGLAGVGRAATRRAGCGLCGVAGRIVVARGVVSRSRGADGTGQGGVVRGDS